MITGEKILENWETFLSNIEKYNSNLKRKEVLQYFYTKFEERFIDLPNATSNEYKGAYPGGYIEYTNKVVNAALEMNKVFANSGYKMTHSEEELVFTAMHFNLGKFGSFTEPLFVPQDNDWFVKNRGEIYKFNPSCQYMKTSDRSIYLLQQMGIKMTFNEFLGVKLSLEIYEESNKNYTYTFANKNSIIPHIIYQSNLIASL